MEFMNRPSRQRFFSPGAILLGLTVLGVAFRVWNLGQRDVWFDEAFTGVALKQPLAEMLSIVKADVHPPLYYLIAKPLAALFQYSVLGIRLLSVVAGVLGIAMTFLFTRTLMSKRAALWASALLAILPFAVQYSQEARMYTTFALFTMASAFTFLLAVQKQSWRWACVSGALIGFGLLTHYLALVYVALIPLAFLPTLFFSEKRRKAMMVSIRLLVAFCLSTGIVFSPWFSSFLIHVRHASSSPLFWISPATPSRALETIQVFLLGTPQGRASQGIIGPNQFSALAPPITLALVLAVAGAAIVIVARKRRSALWPLLVLSFGQILLLYLLSLYGKQYFVSRYMLPSAYFFCVLLGGALSALRASWAAAGMAGYLLLMPLRNTAAPLTDWNDFHDNQLSRAIPHVYVLNPFEYMVAQYELSPERVFLYNSDHPADPIIGWAGIGAGLHQEKEIENVVNDTAGAILTYDPLPMPTFSPAHTTFRILYAHGNLLLYDPLPRGNE